MCQKCANPLPFSILWRRVTDLPLYSHSRPKALKSVNIWCCHQLCTTADKLVSVLPFRSLSSACWSPRGLQSNLVKVCVTFLEIYTKTYRRASFFSFSLLLSFPSLSGYTRITSPTPPPLWHHSLHPPLWAVPPLSVGSTSFCTLWAHRHVNKEEWPLGFTYNCSRNMKTKAQQYKL